MSVDEASRTPVPFKPKKSVALSGTPAGNTAICTVGHSGNDLHYRGYDIINDLATHCEFAEASRIWLIHGKLPTAAELAAYKKRLLGLAHVARPGEARTRATARAGAPDGRIAHRRFGAWMREARSQRSQ